MAIKHARAAQDFAVTTDQLGRHILVTIAMDIGHNGEDAYPSIRTLAQRVGCHYNTVAAWVKTLSECGDLIVTKRGKRQYYNIPFVTNEIELSQPEHDNQYDNGCDNGYDKPSDNLINIVTALSQQVEKLSQQVEKLSQPGSDRSIREEEVREEKYIYDPLLEKIQPLRTALSAVVRETDMPGFDEQKYIDAAEFLFGNDVEPSEVTAFGAWWKANGWHDGKPVLKNVINNWADFKAGICLKGNKNGRIHKPEPAEQRIGGAY